MRILQRICIALSVVVLSTSCISNLQDKVSVESCENLNIMGFSGVKADIGLRNESGRKITLYGVSATIKESGKAIATLSLQDEEIVIPRRTELFETSTLWRLSDVNALAALAASKSIIGGKYENFRVDLSAEVKIGVVKRTVEEKNVELSDLIKSLN